VNSVVFVKYVPDTETWIKVAKDGKSMDPEGVKWVMNPYDEFGVEEALRLKEEFGGEVLVASFGPPKIKEIVLQGMAMGADRGLMIIDDAAQQSDPWSVAKALVAAINDFDFDIIFCGQRGVDADQGLLGPAVAQLLDIPQLLMAQKVEVAQDQKSVKVHRPVEGQVLVLESSLPALITTNKGLNEPRYATLSNILKAKKKPLDTVSLADLGLDASEFGEGARKIKVEEMTLPPARPPITMVQGDTPQELATELARLLHTEAKAI
jgi:electron transfer flavoprotein beta subunit